MPRLLLVPLLLTAAGCSALAPYGPIPDVCRDTAALDQGPYGGQNVDVRPADPTQEPLFDWRAIDASIDYPVFAWRAGIEGAVDVRMTLLPSGETEDLRAIRSPNELLSEAAVAGFAEARGAEVDAPTEVVAVVTFDVCPGG